MNALTSKYADYSAIGYVRFNKNSSIVHLNPATNTDADHVILNILRKCVFIL